MVTVTLRCRHCESRNLVRNGLAADGRQRYLCRDCGQRSREQPRPNAYSEQEREQILRAYDERSSLRGLSRTFGVSRNTVTAWIKNADLPPAVGVDPGGRPPRPLLHGLLGGVREGAAPGAALGGGPGVGRDGARRAVEPDFAAAAGALRAADFILLEVIADARGVFTPLHAPLQL